ncbi:MAG TPA: hypothetical protein DCM71_11865, partial [Runella sp.]|nr:hypothetical protein [Runella sp.]
KDVNGCEKSINISITEPEGLTLASTSISVKCKGGSDGVASVSVSGGTMPYTYAWSNGITSTTNTATGLTAGIYTVTVKDANNCQQSTLVSVAEPAALSATTSSESVKCKGGNDGTASVNVSGGTAPYTYSWSGGVSSTTNTATGLAAGTYTVTIKDANGCQQITTVSVTEPLLVLSLTSTSTTVKCNGGADGAASVSVSGGTAPYSYFWSGGVTSTTNIATGLSAGTYSVTVKDANNCQKSTTITVSEPTGMVLTAASEPTKCFGAKDGVASVSVSGGTAPYTYAWSGGIVSASNTATGLAAGAYTVMVKDANNCQKTLTITVNQPAALVLTSAGTSVKCNGGNDGTASVSASGGTAPYTYSWSNGITSTTNTAIGLATGTYTVTVKDANNCQQSSSITVVQPAGMVLTPTVVAVNCKGGTDGSASIGVTGGTAPYTYAWSGGVSSTTNSATGLAAGTYTVTVKDANNCQQTISITISEPAALVLTPSSTATNCAGSTDGTASVAASGGIAPYSYVWSGGITSTTNTAKGLAAGTYSVTVKDANNCQQTVSITITEPEAATRMVLTPAITPAKCFGGIGSATVAVTGGVSPYTYLWSNGTTTPELTNATAGEYTVTVKDAKGCSTAKATITLTAPTELIITSTVVNACKSQANGRALVSVSGGIAPYTYLWSNGSKASFITNLSAGIYTVTVNDVSNCSKTIQIQITQPDTKLAIDTLYVKDVSCFNGTDGTIIPAVSGGAAPYTYSWSNGSTNENAENLKAGTYSLKVTDSNSCIIESKQVVVNQVFPITLTASTKTPTCKGGFNGMIMLETSGGNGQYTYQWDNGTREQNLFGFPGIYTVTVTDYKGCSKVETFKLEDVPQALTVNLNPTLQKCYGDNTGKLIAIVNGGVAPYQYFWNTGDTTPEVAAVKNQFLSVRVIDKNGCQKTELITMEGPEPIELITDLTNVLCFGASTGEIRHTVGGGTYPLEVNVALDDAFKSSIADFVYTDNRFSSTNTLKNLKTGNYVVTVKDKNGCVVNPQKMTIKQPEAPVSIALGEAISPRGFGLADGKLSFTVKGGTVPFGNYSTSWKVDGTNFDNTSGTVQGNQFFTQSSTAVGGNYLITAIDDNGCKAEFNYLLKQPDKLAANFYSITNPSCAGKIDGQISTSISGGVVNILLPTADQYKLKWFKKDNGVLNDLNVSSPTLSNVDAGFYVVKATDKNDVSAEFEMELKPTPSLYASPTTKNPPCQSTKTGSIQLSNFSGGTAPYTVTWNKGLKGPTITNLEVGLYYAVIKDSKGCFGEVAVRLSPTTDYIIDLYSKKEPICKGECTGELGVYFRKNEKNGGFIVPNTAFWRDANGKAIPSKRTDVGSVASNLCAGVYTMTATAGACEVTKSFEIKVPERSFAIEVSNDLQLCKSTSNVLIDAKQPDAATYQWTLPNGSVLTTPIASIENSGQYKVEVTNTFGCKASDVFNVTILDIETTANFALQNGGTVGLPIVAVPLLVEQKNYKWRLPDGINIVSNNANGLTFIALRPGVFVIQMIVEEEGCEATISKTITITRSGRIATSESAVSVPKGDEEATFIVYPNPSNGQFVIEPRNHAPTDNLEFNVFDAGTGRLLYSNKGANNGQNSFEVNIKEQPQGIVTVVMHKNGKKVTKKVIIQK